MNEKLKNPERKAAKKEYKSFLNALLNEAYPMENYTQPRLNELYPDCSISEAYLKDRLVQLREDNDEGLNNDEI